MRIGILSEFDGYHKYYLKACEDLGVDYEIIDILSSEWIDNVERAQVDGFLVRPSCRKDVWKRMYDEKLYFINKIMNCFIYPSYDEIFLYENKKCMAYWLEIKNIPHAKTNVFYVREEAERFLENERNYPLVFKPSLGSAALGITYLESPRDGLGILNKIFAKGRLPARGYTKWAKTRYGISYPLLDDKQYNFMIVQEKIKVKYEWRMIMIGGSYFGHQKLEKNGFHSGSLLVGWVDPPKALLNMTKEICEKGNFSSMDLDIFEDCNGNFLVNELQSLFGSYDNSQMYIDGVPGRYTYDSGEWKFEEGYFNQNGSCNLRVLDFINKLSKKRG